MQIFIIVNHNTFKTATFASSATKKVNAYTYLYQLFISQNGNNKVTRPILANLSQRVFLQPLCVNFVVTVYLKAIF